jgi:hypothetical protein
MMRVIGAAAMVMAAHAAYAQIPKPDEVRFDLAPNPAFSIVCRPAFRRRM